MTAIATSPRSANQAIGPHFFAEQDRLRGGPAADLCAPSYRARIGSYPTMDHAGHEGFAKAFYAAFEGLHHVVEDVVADDSRVVVRLSIHGKHTGAFFGIPATGKSINVGVIAILQIESSQVSSLEAVFDEAGMLRQLGVLPTS